MGTPKSRSLVHITRLDSQRTAGWQVRFPKWHPLWPLTKYFSDRGHGGYKEALAVARRYRDSYFQEYNLSLLAQGDTRLKAFNAPEAVGVYLTQDRSRPHQAQWSWVGFWSKKRKQGRTSKNIRVHGFEHALELAVRARERNTGVPLTDEALLQSSLLAWLRWQRTK